MDVPSDQNVCQATVTTSTFEMTSSVMIDDTIITIDHHSNTQIARTEKEIEEANTVYHGKEVEEKTRKAKDCAD